MLWGRPGNSRTVAQGVAVASKFPPAYSPARCLVHNRHWNWKLLQLVFDQKTIAPPTWCTFNDRHLKQDFTIGANARRPPPQATSESAFEQKPWQPVFELFFHDLAKRRCKLGNRVTTRWRFQLHIRSHVETPGLSSTTGAETFCQCC